MKLRNASEYAVFELGDVTVHIRTNGRSVTQDVYKTAGLVKLRHMASGRMPELLARALYTELFAEYFFNGSVITFGPRVMKSIA